VDLAASALPKAFRRGTHRAVAPEETFARVRRLMPVMGITRVADVTGLDRIGVPVAMAYRPNARSLAVSAGKGLDLAAAKTSALMESVEGWHAERILAPLLLASVNELRHTHRLADVAQLPRVGGADLHDDLRLLWIEGHDLMAGAPAWLPFEVVHTNYTLPLPTGTGALLASSNGLASGNHLVEAVSHGLYELVERDALALWHARGGGAWAGRRVDLATVDDPSCASVLERFARAGIAVAVWDITSDAGIAAFRATILDADPSPIRSHLPGLGSGCHPCRAVALLRALTEAAQTRLTLISGARDDMGVAHYIGSLDRAVYARIVAEMRAGRGDRSFADAPTFDGETLDADLAWALERLRAAGGAQVLAVDLTKPALGIAVARVVIPGLEGLSDAPGYVPGERCRRALAERAS
jgi:ribosomal protein S12 methylthiotransferase accessory factor